MSQNTEQNSESMRTDKWLWCARLFKTRSVAAEALRKGKVKINGARVKPSRPIVPGDKLSIRKGMYSYHITVNRLAPSRLSADQASLLYDETESSLKQRQKLALQLKTESKSIPRTKGRPTKRERREILRFTRRGG